MDGTSKAGGQTALRLPSELLEQLQQAAEANHRTVSEEMRARLRASFAPTAPGGADQATGKLLDDIAWLAKTLGDLNEAPWYEDAYTAAALRAAIPALLTMIGPKGEPAVNPEGLLSIMFNADELAPEKVGRTYAAMRAPEWMQARKQP